MFRLFRVSSACNVVKHVPRRIVRPFCTPTNIPDSSNDANIANNNSSSNASPNTSSNTKSNTDSENTNAIKTTATHKSNDNNEDLRGPLEILRDVLPQLTEEQFGEFCGYFPTLSPTKGKVEVGQDKEGRPRVINRKGSLMATQLVQKIAAMQKELETLLPTLADKFPLIVSRAPEFCRMRSLKPSFEKVATLFGEEESLKIVAQFPRSLVLAVVASGHALSSPTKLEEKLESLSEGLGHEEALAIIQKDPFILSKNAERTTKIRIEILEAALRLPTAQVLRVIHAIPELLYTRQNRLDRLKCELPPLYPPSPSSPAEGEGDELVSAEIEINPEFVEAVTKLIRLSETQLSVPLFLFFCVVVVVVIVVVVTCC